MRRIRTTFRNAEIPGRIHNLQPFLSVGTLPDGTRRWWGISGPAPDMGHLPRQFHESARSAVYTVISYGTPIAWVTENDDLKSRDPYVYHLPDVGYSPTTGEQQYAIRDAWSKALRRQGTFPALGHGRAGRDGRQVVRVPGNAVVYGRERRLRAGGVDGYGPGAHRSVYDDNLRVRGVSEGFTDARDYDGRSQGLPDRSFDGNPSHP